MGSGLICDTCRNLSIRLDWNWIWIGRDSFQFSGSSYDNCWWGFVIGNRFETAENQRDCHWEFVARFGHGPSINLDCTTTLKTCTVNHESILNITSNSALICSIDVIGRNNFDIAGDVVCSAKIQHLLQFGNSANHGSSNAASAV